MLYLRRGHKMSDERLNALANYFLYFNILDKYGLTFEQFIERVNSGIWKEFVNL